MDEIRFDHLARGLGVVSARRGVLAGLVSGLLAALPAALVGEVAAAKKKRRKKKSKKKLAPCIANCAGMLCGDDGCGGTCGLACIDGKTCQGGVCSCLSGQVVCQGKCADECCSTLDCASGKNCVQGKCLVTSSTCPTGADNCADGTITPCRSDLSCICMVSTANETHCAANETVTGAGCNSCTTDAQCAALRPDIPGIFCAKGGAPCCSGFCLAPCPS